MSFAVPESSSPPSTPNSTRSTSNGLNSFTSMSNNPSTTPAGPPPSSAASFTPDGPPPSSIFGSSQLQVGKIDWGKKPSQMQQPQFKELARTKNGTPRKEKPGASFDAPLFSVSRAHSGVGTFRSSEVPLGAGGNFDETHADEDAEEMEEEDEETDPDEEDIADSQSFGRLRARSDFDPLSSIFAANPSSGQRGADVTTLPNRTARVPRKRDSVIPRIAREIAAEMQTAVLEEPDAFILGTEDIIAQTDAILSDSEVDVVSQEKTLSGLTQQLLRIWAPYTQREIRMGKGDDENNGVLGPGNDSDPITKAVFLSSLLLPLYHPPVMQEKGTLGSRSVSSKSRALTLYSETKLTPIPKVLLDWLNNSHHSYDQVLNAVHSERPNCTSHPLFWDLALGLVIRGRFSDIIQLFSTANFQYAISALEDGNDQPGYRGVQQQNVQRVINKTRQILEACPGCRNDWDTHNNNWKLYRKKVASSLDSLVEFAEGDNRDLSQSTLKTQSNVPWTIYQNLKILYSILLGGSQELVSQSLDWVEAAIAMTVWWDGDMGQENHDWSLKDNRSSRKHAKAEHDQVAEMDQRAVYLRRLNDAYLEITDPADPTSFSINTMSQLEVGLASIFERDIEGVILCLRTWSLAIASTVMETSWIGRWPDLSGQSILGDLDQNDLMVLSYGQEQQKLTKDELLLEYAEELFQRRIFEDVDGEVREGWELAIEIASRFVDKGLMRRTVSDILGQLELDSQERMDKLVRLCMELDMADKAREVAEKFADRVAETSDTYGAALMCYARAHSARKIKNVLDLLISYSLIQSTAYPPDSELDETLDAFIHNRKEAIAGIAEEDPGGAELLQRYFSGYATLRKFYTIRDEKIALKKGQSPSLKPMARKRAAAQALIAVINSAADSIYGGLYDESRNSVVQVDGLLALLGEALPFVGQPKRILTVDQIYSLLGAIEDLQTVTSRVYGQCEECFQSTIRSFHGSLPPSPRATLKKSVSGLTASSGFSLIGSEMLESHPSTRSIGSSGVLVSGNVQRGWDWREGLPRNVKGSDVLRRLRVTLAKELSLALLEEGSEVVMED